MQFPESVRLAAEENAEGFDRKTLSAAASAVSEKYRGEGANGTVIVGGTAETAVYAVVRMPATFAAVSSALEHALTHYGGTVTSAADIGSGTGASALAAAEVIGDELETLDCFERTENMRALGEKLLKASDTANNAVWHDLDITKDELSRSYDLITASYIFNELAPADIDGAVLKLWEKTDGMLLIVEPGTMKGFANIKRIRTLLTENGAKIAYPCPETKSCPLPDNDWCHFTARAARSKLHKQLKGGDVPYEDEKFSCIAAVRADASPCERRILRHPQISAGFVGLHVCTAQGIEDLKITKSSKQFKAARKSECGGEI